jgi:uncharacterized membrane protein YjfL (UPF0719 family)
MAFDRFIHKKLKTEINNQAISVLQLGVILSSAIIFKAIIIPVINLINIGINQSNINFTRLFENISLVFFFLLIGLIFTVLIIFSALYFFMKLTKIDEFDEIKQNKTYTAIVLSAIILGLSIIMESSIGHLCEIIIPFSKLIQIF